MISQKGLTLIGVLKYIVIISIFGIIGFPAYQDFKIRAQVGESLRISQMGKTAIVDFYLTRNYFPSEKELKLPTETGRYLSKVSMNDGMIVSTFGNEAHQNIQGKNIKIIPTANSGNTGSITWTCISNIKQKYLGDICKGE